MNPLDHPCPKCGANAGEKCKNYRGKNKAACPARGNPNYKSTARRRLTSQEKLQNRADRENAEAAAELPLFAQILPRATAEDIYWRGRRNWARAAEHVGALDGSHLLDLLTENRIRRLAQAALSAPDFAALEKYRLETYPPSADYGVGFWMEILSGRKHVVFAWDKIPDANTTLGYRCVPAVFFPPCGWTPPYTQEQLLEMFPPGRFGKDDKPMDFGHDSLLHLFSRKS